ncbi:hypothetical protein IFM89_024690 [Coptis chinensis]|uniref:Vacuolar protein sorting-associated protein 26B n=1 Tax=Coptis chinensis TaxID=261450 RepID=A0A835J0E7_9MAGN|nr:hypothetical protein IFM89_024690 [Coptis chinensis]
MHLGFEGDGEKECKQDLNIYDVITVGLCREGFEKQGREICHPMEVGIEDCLHIEFEYSKSKYHLKDVIIGKIYFLLVRIKIKNMELEIRRRESTGSGPNTYVETETLAKFELMDGAPVRGESIPTRLFLSPYELTPTYRNINNKFSVKYYLNLVLVDEEDRRYFKQQEITVYRLQET